MPGCHDRPQPPVRETLERGELPAPLLPNPPKHANPQDTYAKLVAANRPAVDTMLRKWLDDPAALPEFLAGLNSIPAVGEVYRQLSEGQSELAAFLALLPFDLPTRPRVIGIEIQRLHGEEWIGFPVSVETQEVVDPRKATDSLTAAWTFGRFATLFDFEETHVIPGGVTVTIIWSRNTVSQRFVGAIESGNPTFPINDIVITVVSRPGDVDGDGDVDKDDVAAVQVQIDQAVTPATCLFDVNCDGFINQFDERFVSKRVE